MINGEKTLDRPIRWGMIGGGGTSQIGYIHRSAATRDRMFDLVAGAFDLNYERCQQFGLNINVSKERCYPNYQVMFESEANKADGIEAVSIATPNGTHYEISKAALQAGLHVICEKPLCFSDVEADELVQLAEQKNLLLGVTYGYSGHQMIEQARQMIARGDLGNIRVVKMQFANEAFAKAIEKENPSARWRLDPKLAGPSFILGDVATHVLYLSEVMMPSLRIEELLCAKQSFVDGRELEDNAEVMIRFSNNVFGTLWASGINCGAQHGHKIRIIGEKASIEWWDEHPNQLSFEIAGKPIQLLERGADYLYPEAKEDDRIGGGHAEGLFESWSNLYRRFAFEIKRRSEKTPTTSDDRWYPDVHAGAMGVKFVNACIQSAKDGSVWTRIE